MVHQRVPAVLGGRDDGRVPLGVDGQSIGTLDAVLAEPVHGDGHEAGVGGAVVTQRTRGVGGGLRDARDVGRGPAVQDGPVLQLRGDPGSAREVIELGVATSALQVVDLGPRHGEGHPVLRQRQHTAPPHEDPRAVQTVRRGLEPVRPAQRHRVVTPASGADPVDQAAGGEQRRQPILGLLVDRLPGTIGNRGHGRGGDGWETSCSWSSQAPDAERTAGASLG